jgi:predicted ATPase
MVRAFHDSGVLAEKDALAVKPIWRVDLKRLHSVRLPVTVEDAVGIRVSSLTSKERLLLEHAAAMGNVFWLGGLIALGRMDLSPPEIWNVSDISGTSELQETLQALLQRDYIVQLEGAAFGNETEYVFKQNLEREKIAGLTSAAASRRYHQTIADWLVQNASVRSQEEYTAVLAEHLERAGSLTRAAFSYLEAGDIARNNYAAEDPSHVHVSFYDRDAEPQPGDLDRFAPEEATADGPNLYLFLPGGVGRSKLAAHLTKKSEPRGTLRNWRTVTKLLEMSGEP